MLNLMRRQIYLQENILKKTINLFVILLILCLGLSSKSIANEKWILDKNISSISFEVPVLFATNVIGKFENIDGFVQLDLKDKKNNKAILSVDIGSLKVNYKKYMDLILGPVFFDSTKYPFGVLDTKKFAYNNEEKLNLDIELSIKGVTKIIDTELTIINLTSDLVQIKGLLEISRKDFNIGTGNWKNATILKDNIIIKSNLFLMRN